MLILRAMHTPTTCDLIISFPELLLGLHFTGPKVCPILVQLSGTFFLIVTKTYLILVFLKTGLKHGNLRIVRSRKKGVLRNFIKFTGKHLCQSLFFNKIIPKLSTLLIGVFRVSCYQKKIFIKYTIIQM